MSTKIGLNLIKSTDVTPIPWKMSTQNCPSCPCGTVIFKKSLPSFFCIQTPLIVDVLYGHWTAPKGPSIKNVCTKSRKIDPLPPCPQNVGTGSSPPPLSVRTYHKFRKIRSFLHQKRKLSALDNPSPLTADVLYGRFLTGIFIWWIVTTCSSEQTWKAATKKKPW